MSSPSTIQSAWNTTMANLLREILFINDFRILWENDSYEEEEEFLECFQGSCDQ